MTLSQGSGSLTCSTIRIMEFPDKDINPPPLSHGILTDSGALSEHSYNEEEYLSPQRLHELTGIEDLSQLVYLEMRVDATENSLGNFGVYLPNLLQLKLNDSVIKSVRDIGSSLRKLTVLWMNNCKLEDLDGISSISQLQELYLADNQLTDISPLSILEDLEILNLAENKISEMEQLGYLGLCPKLIALQINGNPFCILLSSNVETYKQAVLKIVPHLQFLDQKPLTAEAAKQGCLMSQSSLLSMSLADVDNVPTERSNHKLIESFHQDSQLSGRGTMLLERPATVAGFRPNTSSQVSVSKSVDESSELTHGINEVFCGNPARALRARRKKKGLTQQSELFPGEFDRPYTSPGAYVSPDREGSPVIREEIMEDLKLWREEYEKLSVTLRETTFDESNTVQSPVMQQIECVDGLTVTATKSVVLLDVESDDEEMMGQASYQLRTKKRQLPATPHPPSSFQPLPPSKTKRRPHTAGDFRSRRYRKQSLEEQVQLVGQPVVKPLDGDRVHSILDDRQPSHLTSINGQVPSQEDSVVATSQHAEKKPHKKLPNPPIDTDNPILKASTKPKTRRKLPNPKHPTTHSLDSDL